MKKLLTSLILSTTLLVSTVAFAGNTVTVDQKKVNVMFIQIADGGSLMPIKDQPGYYQLELKGIKEYTGYFSDRPARISGIYPTALFVANWTDGTKPSSFNKMPPNAALSTVIPHLFSKKVVNLPIQLSNPSYDAKQQIMSYTVQILPGAKTSVLPLKDMGQTELFIDNYCAGCVGHF